MAIRFQSLLDQCGSQRLWKARTYTATTLLLDLLSAVVEWGVTLEVPRKLCRMSKKLLKLSQCRSRQRCSIRVLHRDGQETGFPSNGLFLSDYSYCCPSLRSLLRCGPSIRPETARGLHWDPCNDDGMDASQRMPKCQLRLQWRRPSAGGGDHERLFRAGPFYRWCADALIGGWRAGHSARICNLCGHPPTPGENETGFEASTCSPSQLPPCLMRETPGSNMY